MLDNRLTMCMDLVGGSGTVCDVGTDHALLAAELINSGKCAKVIASDINEGPLEAAKKTVERFGFQDKIDLVLSDGLKNVPLYGVSDVVIAGMGGETIAAIIGNVDVANEEYADIRWILQPMTKPELLRKKLYEYGLVITDEKAVVDGDKLYIVMAAEYSPYSRRLTETESLYGFFTEGDELGFRYRYYESQRFAKIAMNLEMVGKSDEAQHFNALSQHLMNGIGMEKIDDVISFLNSEYPFALQEKWDNSGYLVESSCNEVSKILLTLDITYDVVNEADCKGAELIISHHPVIFDARKRIARNDPVYRLIESGIGALCLHTNLDIAEGGTNSVILRKLQDRFSAHAAPEPFEELGNEQNLGWIITLDEYISADEFGKALKQIFGCTCVRASLNSNKKLSKIAFCSGSGGSMLGLAVSKGCDALITGDVKHDVWIDANNKDIALFDCGHFHTENIVLWELRRVLEKRFPQLDIEISERSIDPCRYI